LKDFDPTSAQCFYEKCSVLSGPLYPEAAEVRQANRGDLDEADVVVTNIHQLQGAENKWLLQLPSDFFDAILFDEGHHNVAESWQMLRRTFPKARIINFSATPARADGQLMTGKIIYSFPVREAIAAGFVKSLKAVVLNPATLKYVRREDGEEVEVSLKEVIELGEEDADFRRSIVSSEQSLATIVNCSIRELRRLRELTGDGRLKIIASALNYQHCIQIAKAYQERNLRAAYVHSKEDGQANKRILQKLERHELDVVVQVRKLAEGFDHKYLSVAAVCSVFSNLSPFVQFVGRIMRWDSKIQDHHR
jgi:superfamily II DNA or RNA helicase